MKILIPHEICLHMENGIYPICAPTSYLRIFSSNDWLNITRTVQKNRQLRVLNCLKYLFECFSKLMKYFPVLAPKMLKNMYLYSCTIRHVNLLVYVCDIRQKNIVPI